MSSQKTARQQYLDSVRELLAAGAYVELLASEGEQPRSLAFKQQAFSGYEPTAKDIIVSTFPKSGTNWMMQMAQEIAWHGDAQFEHIDAAIPWPDALTKTPVASLADTTMSDNSPTGLRVIKSHLEAEYVPYSAETKYISVIRNPKDVIVSSFYFANGFFERMVGDIVPLDAYVESMLREQFIYGDWAANVASWWKIRERDNVLVLLFEEMKQSPDETISQVAAFLDVDLSAETHAKVAHKSSYAYMKANDHKFSPPTPADYQTQGTISMVRQGKAGGNVGVLSTAQREAIDTFCVQQLQQLGSDFPYQQHY